MMDSYPDFPPPAYSPYDPTPPTPQQREVPNCLRINRKPVATPEVQVRPVHNHLEPPRTLRHGRSVGDLRRDDLHANISRKPVYAPTSSYTSSHLSYGPSSPVNNQNGLARPSLHGARSVGDLRRANMNIESTFPPLPSLPPQMMLQTPQYQPNFTDSQLYLSPIDADSRRPRTSHSSEYGSTSRASSAHSNMSSSSINTERPFQTSQSSMQSNTPSPTISERPLLSTQSSGSSISSAYREARHFVGGLIPHPVESTKHYTILRHSHGLVFYQGTSTTLAITIFADMALPLERTIWLQNRGWSGNTGMRLKGLMGADGSWLNVTPSTRIRAEQLKPTDERAWQRDISSFQKKANRRQQEHLLRETAIVRIPAEAGDGYFQLVLCLGEKKKVLCSSPVFRVASTSTTPYSVKGASLKTLPLELGALALTTYARNTAGRVLGPAAAVASTVQGRVEKYMPSFWVQKAASEATGAWQNRHAHMQENQAGGSARKIDLEQGPLPPYPIHFSCRSEPASTETSETFSTPTIRLARVPDAMIRTLHGFYYGWCQVQPNEKGSMNGQEWYQVVISALLADVSQLARVDIQQASKKHFAIRLIRDSGEEFSLDGTKLGIQVMGFIRPDEPLQRAVLEQGLLSGDEAASEAAVLANVNDMAMTLSILDHPAWDADPNQIRAGAGLSKVMTGLTGARDVAQRQLARVPLHMAGVRSPVDAFNGGMVSNGFYVVR